MSYVNAAIGDVLKVAPKGAIVVVESTISPGSIDRYVRPYVESKGFKIGEDIHLVHAPERIIPGNMVYELLHNDRTIGADDPAIGEKVKELYASFCGGQIVVTDRKTAEMTKVIENTFRCVNIAFANELAKICRHDGMDVYKVIEICNMHPRVNILNPGPGVGGHCIPVDPWFLVGDYPSLTKVIGESLKVNASMPEYVLERICEIMEEKGIEDVRRVGLYGLTFKENVDDYRDSPTLQLLEAQRKHLGQPLKVYDPWNEHDLVKNQYHDLDEFLDSVDLVVIMVKHNEIKENMDTILQPLFHQFVFLIVSLFVYSYIRYRNQDNKLLEYIIIAYSVQTIIQYLSFLLPAFNAFTDLFKTEEAILLKRQYDGFRLNAIRVS